MYVSAYFSDRGSPKTGLSPTLDIYDLADNSLDVNGAAMMEVGGGFYKYDFSGYSAAKNYAILCDGGSGLIGTERYSIGTRGKNYIVVAFFFSAGSPKTGLSPTVDIYDVSDNSLDVNGAAMTEVGGGFYQYSFTAHDTAKDYLVICDGGVSLNLWERYAIIGNEDIESVVLEHLGAVTILSDGKINTDLEISSDVFADTTFADTHGVSIESVEIYNVAIQEVSSINVDITAE